jgi:hypothetical protein
LALYTGAWFMVCAVLITFNNSGFPCGGQRFSCKGKGRTL